MRVSRAVSLLFAALFLCWANIGFSATLFQEGFDDSNLSGRGWYDNTNPIRSTAQHVANSTSSAQFHFATGAVTPDNGGTMRKKFTASDSVYVSYYIKYSSNWVGSGVSYHPHMFYILTNKDSDWVGPSWTYLTMYIEENGGYPQVGIQDGVNVNKSNINQNLVGISEARAVAGCNGDSDGYGKGECYAGNSGNYNNGKMYKTYQPYITDTAGPFYKGDWHLVETYVKLNSIVSGVGQKDGILQHSIDGTPVLNYNNVVFRTGQNATMQFNQFIIGPYIGVGSPVDQTFWVDSLVVATAPPTAKPAAPQNLMVH